MTLIEPGNSENWLRALWRLRFLYLLDEEAPEVKRELKSELWPLLRDAVESLFRRVSDLPAVFGVSEISDAADRSFSLAALPYAFNWFNDARKAKRPEVAQLIEALAAWQQRHNLTESWVEETAIRTLVGWALWPPSADGGEWHCFRPAFPGASHGTELRLAVEIAWDPVTEPRTDARQRLLDELSALCREQVESFLDSVEDAVRERGLEDVPHHPQGQRHLRWLVRYQVDGEGFTEIAGEDLPADPKGSGRKTVASGVRQAAKLVGLTLRAPARGGRPPRR